MERVLKQTLPKGRFPQVDARRSKAMSRIRGEGARSTEVAFRMMLVRSRIKGWTMHPSGLPAKPDFFFAKLRLAIFIDGCFWHACPKCGHVPSTNTRFWEAKFALNRSRDLRDKLRLRKIGVLTIRLWEHQVQKGLSVAVVRQLIANVEHFRKRPIIGSR
jgi:DNA mismatch endonuclease, patch repair protein